MELGRSSVNAFGGTKGAEPAVAAANRMASRGTARPVRRVNLGLDFGTSTTKVVVRIDEAAAKPRYLIVGPSEATDTRPLSLDGGGRKRRSPLRRGGRTIRGGGEGAVVQNESAGRSGLAPTCLAGPHAARGHRLFGGRVIDALPGMGAQGRARSGESEPRGGRPQGDRECRRAA